MTRVLIVDGEKKESISTDGPEKKVKYKIVEVEDGEGVKTVLSTVGEAKDGREVVFAVNRLGEARVALILPAEPFPSFHGRGGNRGRGGDPTRIREVRKIWLRHPDPAGSP